MCRHKDQISGAERRAAVSVYELTATRNHDIELVARMRLLRIGATGRVDLDRQRAVPEELAEGRATRARQPRERRRRGQNEGARFQILHRATPAVASRTAV